MMIEEEVATGPGQSSLLERGRPLDDSRAFRRCLGQYPTGVAVITASHGSGPVGMTVNSFASVSLDPPLILWSIRRESRSVEVFRSAEHFVVNVLAHNQVEVSQWFCKSDPEKFELVTWEAGLGGAPLIHGAVAQLECQRFSVQEAGDHLILIGEVKQYAHFDGKPLTFSNGEYAMTQVLPREPVSRPN
ncbi:flavin reductase family protein [Burkholderia sp. WSM2230]|uniref:flavin reductase family protein n=1 Tax=Burkholderia sp. WSM2230 TaxID=944435 RepID=UPI0003FD4186|nr:flavin reductase family protein [Burkholderia sp. WSM2230]